jgi:hypothetical protein
VTFDKWAAANPPTADINIVEALPREIVPDLIAAIRDAQRRAWEAALATRPAGEVVSDNDNIEWVRGQIIGYASVPYGTARDSEAAARRIIERLTRPATDEVVRELEARADSIDGMGGRACCAAAYRGAAHVVRSRLSSPGQGQVVATGEIIRDEAGIVSRSGHAEIAVRVDGSSRGAHVGARVKVVVEDK